MTSRRSPISAPPELHNESRDLETALSWLLERTGYARIQWSGEGCVLDLNETARAMLGFRDGDDVRTVSMSRDVFADLSDYDRVQSHVSAAQSTNWIESQWKQRDGTLIAVRLAARAVAATGQYECIAEDLTTAHRREEVLRRQERMATLGAALAGVAHELNNPLAAIIGFAQLLLKKPWPDEDRSALDTIGREAARSARIVRDLLALVRKREVDRRSATNVNEIAAYVLGTRRYALETAGIRCELRLDPALPSVLGDRAQLEQIILNLLNNADHAVREVLEARGHAAAPAGRITIATRQEGADVVLEVEDTGPGVPEEERSRIWDPFWTTRAGADGIGLGLTMVHGLVAEHGGTIEVGGEAGSGARFTIRLPVAEAQDGVSTSGYARQPLDVLVVHPGASDIGFVERFLVSRGHVVLTAPTPNMALQLAQQGEFDVVVCGAALTHGGEPLAARLRASEGCARARVIVVAGEPYDLEELRRSIESE